MEFNMREVRSLPHARDNSALSWYAYGGCATDPALRQPFASIVYRRIGITATRHHRNKETFP